MFARCWAVGRTDESTMSMTMDDVSGDLAADWLPSLPPDIGSSFMGWPPYLLGGTNEHPTNFLMLKRSAGQTERQWKNVLSWMLGVAGTRRYLRSEDYRWVAPASAFYPEAVQSVDLSGWHEWFRNGRIRVEKRDQATARLRPDYIAMHSTSGLHRRNLNWAVVEAKGTQNSLASRAQCPGEWAAQVRNVRVFLDDVEISVRRHLVVATRINPNAVGDSARRIQIRAWNNNNEAVQNPLPPLGGVYIAGAHLFGLFSNLHLPENARAVGQALQALNQRTLFYGQERKEILRLVKQELDERTDSSGRGSRVVTVSQVKVKLAEPILNFGRNLLSSEDGFAVLNEMDESLDAWRSRQGEVAGSLVLPYGVEIVFPKARRK